MAGDTKPSNDEKTDPGGGGPDGVRPGLDTGSSPRPSALSSPQGPAHKGGPANNGGPAHEGRPGGGPEQSPPARLTASF